MDTKYIVKYNAIMRYLIGKSNIRLTQSVLKF